MNNSKGENIEKHIDFPLKSYSLRSDTESRRINYKEFLDSRLNISYKHNKFSSNIEENDVIVIESSSEDDEYIKNKNKIEDEIINVEFNQIDNYHDALDEEDKSSWVSENNQERWCICQEPWDKRFMIMCDKCMDWYHGDCVGLTKEDGKKLEKNDESYVCPYCKSNQIPKDELIKKGINLKEKIFKNNLVNGDNIKVNKYNDNSDIYISKNINIMTNKSKINNKTNEQTEKITPHKESKLCINSSCKKKIHNVNNSLFCNNFCIKEYVKSYVKKLNQDQRIKFYDTSNGKIKVYKSPEINKITKSDLERLYLIFIRKPYYRFYEQKQDVLCKLKKNTINLKNRSMKSNELEISKKEKFKTQIINNKLDNNIINKINDNKISEKLRISTRNSLKDALDIRLIESDDNNLKANDSICVLDIAKNIEEEMFKFYGEKNANKYKSKYRSLCFNIKDKNNNFFFKRILLKDVLPEKLIKMTSEEMASKELSEWREKKTREDLEAIERAQIEASLRKKNKQIKITHKGEIFVRDEDMSDLNNNSSSKILNNDKVLNNKNKFDKEYENLNNISLIDKRNDTTIEHKYHLFDIYCKICTGVSQESKNDENNFEIQRLNNSNNINLSTKQNIIEDLNNNFIELNENSEPKTNEFNLSFNEINSTNKSPTVNYNSNILLDSINEPEEILWNGYLKISNMTNEKINLKATFLDINSNKFKYTEIEDIPLEIEQCARVQSELALNYIRSLKSHNSKNIYFIKFEPIESTNNKDDLFLKYLNILIEKSRFGVMKPFGNAIKDFYLIPVIEKKTSIDAVEIIKSDFSLKFNKSSNFLIGVLISYKKKIYPNFKISNQESYIIKDCKNDFEYGKSNDYGEKNFNNELLNKNQTSTEISVKSITDFSSKNLKSVNEYSEIKIIDSVMKTDYNSLGILENNILDSLLNIAKNLEKESESNKKEILEKILISLKKLNNEELKALKLNFEMKMTEILLLEKEDKTNDLINSNFIGYKSNNNVFKPSVIFSNRSEIIQNNHLPVYNETEKNLHRVNISINNDYNSKFKKTCELFSNTENGIIWNFELKKIFSDLIDIKKSSQNISFKNNNWNLQRNFFSYGHY